MYRALKYRIGCSRLIAPDKRKPERQQAINVRLQERP
jgi:hypothetical protein